VIGSQRRFAALYQGPASAARNGGKKQWRFCPLLHRATTLHARAVLCGTAEAVLWYKVVPVFD